ncbi:MAG: response regulator [Bacteroidales bacterium]|nr:response regulator [Bacteroidales bacterium]
MKKSIFIGIAAGLILLIINIFIFNKLYHNHLNYQKNILVSQSELCSETIEDVIQRFESDLNFILFSDDISELFADNAENSNSLRKLELFYSSYTTLIKNIDIYDNQKNVFNIFKDKDFITDRYLAQRQRKLVSTEQVKSRNSEYHYYIPVFKDNEVFGNIVVSINLSNYIMSELEKFHVPDNSFQWIINPVEKNFQTNLKAENIIIQDFNIILSNLTNDLEDIKIHVITTDSAKLKVITAYKTLDLLDHKFGIAFSYINNYFIKEIVFRVGMIFIISTVLILFTIFFLIIQVGKSEKKTLNTLQEKEKIHNVLQNLPIGVIVFDDHDKIIYINQIAKELFLIREGEEFTKNTVVDKFLMTGHRSIKEKGKVTAYDSNQFILYQREGNEVILYRKEVPYFIDEKEFILSAFIDITSLEKARKYEAASNTAKSEFLAKMSHEIRTPMNGIIGMTDALNQKNLTKEQKEYVDIVKRSADLLLNIIDDILDYSKIEAGKMQLEEIPFKISEEVKLSLDLFRAIIEDKGIKLAIDISPDVPDDIIGDPFRLRQVLSNLISNSVKFTHEGEIRISVKLDEKYNGNLTLLFEVADTGVGIPNERLDSIFNSFTQAEQSTSRKYGGSGLGTTISKQLVNLMHGEIWVESPSGISKNKKYPGSIFSFTIEVFSNEDIVKNIDFSDIKSFDQVNAFIIAQNIATKKRLQGFLDHLGINTNIVELTEDTQVINNITKQLSGSDNYHLVFIMDEVNLDGLWLANQLNHKKINDQFRIVMISSNHKQENYIQTKVARIDSYLLQPFDQNILKGLLLKWFPGIEHAEKEKLVSLRKDLNILVAEDNLINQKVAETIFSSLGYTIDIAIDGKEVVEMVKKKSYDIVFMDLQMPEKDGVDATVEIRGLGFQMPIIAMTATASKIGKNSAITSGMNDYIVKPVKVDAVRTVLEKWFG